MHCTTPRFIYICLLACLLPVVARTQNPGVWTPLFSYKFSSRMVEGDGKIYCKAENALFSYTVASGEIETLTKADRLSDVRIADIAYDTPRKQLLVLYSSGNIDLVGSAGTILINSLKSNKSILNKTLYCATIVGERAYIGADFGIAVLNLATHEFEDSYFIGPQAEYLKVSRIVIDSTSNRMFAATPKGLMVASLKDRNLADFNSWSLFKTSEHGTFDMPITHLAANGKYIYLAIYGSQSKPAVTYQIEGLQSQLFTRQQPSITDMTVSNGQLHITDWKKIYVYDRNNYLRFAADSSSSSDASFMSALTTSDSRLWVSQISAGITEVSKGKAIMPNGPFYDQISSIVFDSENRLYASFGEKESFRIGGFGTYNGQWLNRPVFSSYEMLCIALHPTKKNAFYLGSYGRGLYQYDGIYSLNTVYNSDNSPLENHYQTLCKIYDVKADKYGNMWASDWPSTIGIKILDPSGNWHSVKIPGHPTLDYINKIFITSRNQKIFTNAIPVNSTYTICAFDEKKTWDDTSDDAYTVLGLRGGEDQDFASYVFSIAEDNNGALWIGTNNGVATLSDLQAIFTVPNPQFRRIKVVNDSIVDYLLDGVEVRSIAIDAGNRKWFGTLNDGVFLMSDNCTEVIQHFTAENSPLPSNFVSTIAIRPSDGQVFFCTDNGTVSYSSNAYKGVATMDKIKVVPNPVREHYRGDIFISGLVDDAHVKITDLTGNLVFETYSNGGMATWHGRNLLGKRPQTGVYLIFISNDDGTSTRVGKLIFVN